MANQQRSLNDKSSKNLLVYQPTVVQQNSSSQANLNQNESVKHILKNMGSDKALMDQLFDIQETPLVNDQNQENVAVFDDSEEAKKELEIKTLVLNSSSKMAL